MRRCRALAEGLVSRHVSADGTLVRTTASYKSFVPLEVALDPERYKTSNARPICAAPSCSRRDDDSVQSSPSGHEPQGADAADPVGVDCLMSLTSVASILAFVSTLLVLKPTQKQIFDEGAVPLIVAGLQQSWLTRKPRPPPRRWPFCPPTLTLAKRSEERQSVKTLCEAVRLDTRRRIR
jgi:hypothetical protein